jgi:F-type H+-transporting ATPase subunit a
MGNNRIYVTTTITQEYEYITPVTNGHTTNLTNNPTSNATNTTGNATNTTSNGNNTAAIGSNSTPNGINTTVNGNNTTSNATNTTGVGSDTASSGGNGDCNSPLDQFAIRDLLSLDAIDASVSLTNIGLYLTLASLIVLIVSLISNNYNKILSNSWSASQESVYATLHSIVINQINEKKGQMYFPFIFTLFIFILSNNLIGMVPYSFASTSHFILTFSLSFMIVLGATFLGFIYHYLKFFSLFVPSGCPLALLPLLVLIEFISYLARNVSLGLRLAANILSGHMLLNILSGFTYNIMNSGFFFFFLALLPLAFIIAFSGLELAIAFIQAQVFVVLSCSYIKDSLELH